LNREFKNLRRGVLKLPSPIEIGLGSLRNDIAKIFGLLFIGYLNLVLGHISTGVEKRGDAGTLL
jgi:hypothetical protein